LEEQTLNTKAATFPRAFRPGYLLLTGASIVLGLVQGAEARITSITITSVAPAYGGVSFGSVGPYQFVTGVANGAVDPRDPRNAVIQDIELAPIDAKGLVEYSTKFQILMPVDETKGNHVMLSEVVNRGNETSPGTFNIGTSTANPQGDGFLEKQGLTLVWAGWQADLVAPASNPGLITMSAPIAHHHSSATITGVVRSEWIVSTPTGAPGTQNILAESSSNTPGYASVTTNNAGLTLTERVHQNDPKVPIPNSQWAFADCTSTPFPGLPNPQKVCLQNGFDTNHIYELIYTAKDPIVMGLGLAALRDVSAFFHHAATDNNGTANPLAGQIAHTILRGDSQSGRLLRTFLELGFNEDESGQKVFEGMHPHIGSVRNYINVRFSQPGRLAGTQHTEKQYPGPDSPLTYQPTFDPFTGEASGLLDRCTKTGTCPKIVHTMSDIEYWEASGRGDTTDPLGTRDLQISSNVRIYQFSSAQHGGFSPVAPVPTSTGICEQLPDANTYTYNMRALLVALEEWVAHGTLPPDSQYSRLDRDTLVPVRKVKFPNIPGVAGPAGIFNTRFAYYRGPRYDTDDLSGIIAVEPPIPLAEYPSFVPQVDADGNDIDGLRSHILQAPLGTYAGWNVRAAGFSQGDACDLTGSYIPFAVTKAERLANGDSRLSLQERYGNTAGYVGAVTAAVNSLVSQRLLLASDAVGAISNATAWFTQASGGMLP
jgi:Alpha/beta hydrolase domain